MITPGIFFKNFNLKKNNSILCLEYWCFKEDEFWKEDDEKLIELAKKEIRLSGLIRNESVIKGKVIRVPNCYPIYSAGYKENLKPIINYLSSKKKLSVIGRYGSFKYNNQDHSILMGILAAENISNNSKHNLWEINSDYQYQESSTITSIGLAR